MTTVLIRAIVGDLADVDDHSIPASDRAVLF
jgi:hypothetical protein